MERLLSTSNQGIRALLWFLQRNLPVLLTGAYRRGVRGLPYCFSFNIADRCPIGCDCYWRAQARVPELSDDAVIGFFEKKRSEGYLFASIVGGEPYVRPELLTKVAGIIPLNWVITSGTTPLRRLRNTTHVVSVDGANAASHDGVRKSKGLYDRILKNLGRARADGDFPAIIHTTLNAFNYKEIAEILALWADSRLADGILVSTITPIKGAGDEALILSREQRIWVVEELLRLKREYSEFLFMTEPMIRRLHPLHTERLDPQVCNTAKWIESYDAAGNRVSQCILSEKADCTRCGCVITTTADRTQSLRTGSMLESMRVMRRTFSIS
jgi:MoaA/NifB/PqqE/SkfB family radical SAM enzyme